MNIWCNLGSGGNQCSSAEVPSSLRVGWIDSVAVCYAADREVRGVTYLFEPHFKKKCGSRKWRLLSNSPTELKMLIHVDIAAVCNCVHGMHSYSSVNIIIICCSGPHRCILYVEHAFTTCTHAGGWNYYFSYTAQ